MNIISHNSSRGKEGGSLVVLNIPLTAKSVVNNTKSIPLKNTIYYRDFKTDRCKMLDWDVP